LLTVTPRQVEAAKARVCELEGAWKRHDLEKVDPAHFAQQEEGVRWLAENYRKAKDQLTACQATLAGCQLERQRLERQWASWLKWKDPAIGILTGFIGGAASLLLGILIGLPGGLGLGILVWFIGMCLTALAVVYWYVAKEQADQRMADITVRLSEIASAARQSEKEIGGLLASFKEAEHHWGVAHSRYQRLREVLDIQRAYERACQERDRLLAVAQSRQYQLVRWNWRDLRGTAFEQFLGEVFQLLGFAVQLTKRSGDLGVDLILSGKGKRIAIQAKGYADKLDQAPVREVVAGARAYQCDKWAVGRGNRAFGLATGSDPPPHWRACGSYSSRASGGYIYI
jgi:hypothetical protein